VIRRAGAHAGRSDEGSGRFVRAFGQAASQLAGLDGGPHPCAERRCRQCGLAERHLHAAAARGVVAAHAAAGGIGRSVPGLDRHLEGPCTGGATFDRAGGSTTSAPPTAKAIAMAASPSGADTSEAAGAAAAPVCACPGCAFAAPAPTSAAITRMAAASNGARRRVRDIRWRMYRPPAAIQGRALPHSSRCRDREGEGEDRERFRECGFQDTQRGIVRPSPASPERLGRRHRLPSCRRFEQ